MLRQPVIANKQRDKARGEQTGRRHLPRHGGIDFLRRADGVAWLVSRGNHGALAVEAQRAKQQGVCLNRIRVLRKQELQHGPGPAWKHNMHTCIHARLYVCTHTHTRARARMHTHACTRPPAHAQSRICTHTHTPRRRPTCGPARRGPHTHGRPYARGRPGHHGARASAPLCRRSASTAHLSLHQRAERQVRKQ